MTKEDGVIVEFLKASVPWIGMAVAIVASHVRHGVTLKKHEALFSSGENGTVPFITDARHEKAMETCKDGMYEKIASMESNMKEMKETMRKGDECRSDARAETSGQLSAIRRDMKDFQNQMFDIINPLVIKVALNELEIDHMNGKIKENKK